MEDFTHIDAVTDEFGARRLDVGHDQERAAEPGAAGVTLPKWIEAGEPGGVNCTTRNASPTEKSASSRQPGLL